MAETAYQRNARVLATDSLRERWALGWRPALNAEYRALVARWAEGDEMVKARCDELAALRCWLDDDEPQAYYSIHCCYWTNRGEDLGATGNDRQSIPCCPSCGSPLLQAPLISFVESAIANPTHYDSERGLDLFWIARGFTPCRTKWAEYATEVPWGESAPPPPPSPA